MDRKPHGTRRAGRPRRTAQSHTTQSVDPAFPRGAWERVTLAVPGPPHVSRNLTVHRTSRSVPALFPRTVGRSYHETIVGAPLAPDTFAGHRSPWETCHEAAGVHFDGVVRAGFDPATDGQRARAWVTSRSGRISSAPSRATCGRCCGTRSTTASGSFRSSAAALGPSRRRRTPNSAVSRTRSTSCFTPESAARRRGCCSPKTAVSHDRPLE